MKEKIEKAFADFDKGHRPDGYKPPRNWYVLNKAGKPYPAKAIWAMAIGKRPGGFNTRKAQLGLIRFEYSLLNTNTQLEADKFESAIEKAMVDSKQERQKRLSKAPKKPDVIYTLTKTYRRNPDVVAEVLTRAKGVCEKCKSKAPFNRKKDRSPYLEVHHIKQLAQGGEDTVKNAIALCPNCHRKCHFG